MSIYDWISIGIACFIGAASPGPSLLIIIYHNTTKGMMPAMICALGHGVGIFIYAILTILGIKYFFITFPNILLLVKIVGIVFLLFISFQMLLFKNSKPGLDRLSPINLQKYNSLTLGILTALTNPKVILFFGAIFSQFIKEDLTLNDKLLISVVASSIDAIWYMIIVFVSTFTLSNYLKKYKKLTINCFGLLLIFITSIMIKKIF